MNKEVEWWEYGLLIIGYTILISFFVVSILNADGTWFARSGSLGVIFGVFLEYNFAFQQQKLNQEIGKNLNLINNNILDYSDSKAQKRVKAFTHILLVLSTVIWGYGDLLFT